MYHLTVILDVSLCDTSITGPAGFEPSNAGVKVLCLNRLAMAHRCPFKRQTKSAYKIKSKGTQSLLKGWVQGLEPWAFRATI